MNQRIPEETVEAVRSSVNIVDVISTYVQLTKQGRNYMGLCPFHGENTPSFSVSEERQLYHCFGCGAGGNAISFMMEMEQISFPEAVSQLAPVAGVEISLPHDGYNNSPERASEREMIEGHELAAKLFHHLLMNTSQGEAAYEYLQSRGLTEEVMQAYQLGYAPEHRQTLVSLFEKRGYSLERMTEAGLLVRSDRTGEYFDRFSGRVMFPVAERRGRLIAFGGRALGEDEPKYLNSTETPVFKKNETLYGFAAARQAIRRSGRAVLFEGYMDVIAAYRAGLEEGVATLGTSFTEAQARVLRRNAGQVTVCYDGDGAGVEAALKAAELLDGGDVDIRISLLPEGMDPDDYISSYGTQAFLSDIIEGALPVVAFKIQSLKRGRNLQQEGDRLAYIEDVLAALTDVPRAVEREHYMQQLAEEFSLSLDALKQEQYRMYKQKRRRGEAPQQQKRERTPKTFESGRLRSRFENAERHLLHHMLRDRSTAYTVEQQLGGEFNVNEHTAIAAYLYAYYNEGRPPDVSAFLERLEDEELQRRVCEIDMIENGEYLTEEALFDYIEQIRMYPKWVEIEEKEKQVKLAEQRQDMTEAVALANEVLQLRKALQNQRHAPM
ncbi:DNA primase [Salsuginibacillus halophilus]|uniref:DNA primase n=1 Tax=Salsuginibacillus halophilus TaxID=517424 RepID=A0A2P8HFN5_9BACI|nr:DNA primase [Salsuginibacillus halophilus]PSL45011.1 DNA primase [Salsuginibacillus halophilus]